MATMPELEVFITIGVDTHKDIHVASGPTQAAWSSTFDYGFCRALTVATRRVPLSIVRSVIVVTAA